MTQYSLPRPVDDLYRSVNGDWLRTHVIPADKAIDGTFTALRDESLEQCKELIDACVGAQNPSHDQFLIASLYQAYMDTEKINQAGIAPLAPLFDLIDSAHDHEALASVMGTLAREGISGWFEFFISLNPLDTDQYCPTFVQGGITLPDEAYYREEAHATIRTAFSQHVEAMGNLAKVVEPAEFSRTVFRLETAFASSHMSAVESREAEATTNMMTFAELADSAPGFAWDAWARALGVESFGTINNSMPHALTQGAHTWALTPLSDLQTWLHWMVLTSYAGVLPHKFVEENFHFFGQTLAGTKELRPRWKRGVSYVESLIGMALGRLYVDKFFSHEAKEKVTTLVNNLLEAYRNSITELPWMTPQTKAQALEKLSNFHTKIGYPDIWRDYSSLSWDNDADIVQIIRRAQQYESDHELQKIGHDVDRTEWLMTPQTVNAYYYPVGNEIVFPAAILRDPFFDADRPEGENYGAIGAVIGHEIGHGFDDQGSKYDGHGRLRNWWSSEDQESFSARTRALIAQYDSYTLPEVDPDLHINGSLTIGENIGDLGGLSIALKAWEIARSQHSNANPSEEEMKDFFISWARIWRSAVRPEMAKQLIAIDPHSPAQWRCNGVVRNMDAFHDTFHTSPGDDLWLDPTDRVTIW